MRQRAVWLIALIMLAATVGLATLGWPSSDYLSGDFFQFRAGARAILEGTSPYDGAWWRAFHAREGSQALLQPWMRGGTEWTTPYPFWTFLLLIPFGAMPLGLSAAAWLICQLTGVVVAVRSLTCVLGLESHRLAMLLLVALGIAFEPMWFLVQGGNVTGFVFTAFGLSIAAALAGRYRIAGVLFAFILIKPQSFAIIAPVLVLGLIAPARRPFLLGVASVALPLATASFAIQPGWVGGWVSNAVWMQGTEYSNATGWTLGRVVGGPALSLAMVGGIILAFAAWWKVRRPAFPELIAAATPVSVFVSFHGWTHEHLYLLVPVTIVLARSTAMSKNARHVTSAALVVLLVILPWVLLLLPRDGETLSALVPLGCFGLVVWVDWRVRRGASYERHASAERSDTWQETA